MIIRHKNYKDMNWKELTAEGKRRGLDRQLFSFKGVEGIWEQYRIEVISQLNSLDQQKDSRDAKLFALISALVGTITLIVSLISLITNRN